MNQLKRRILLRAARLLLPADVIRDALDSDVERAVLDEVALEARIKEAQHEVALAEAELYAITEARDKANAANSEAAATSVEFSDRLKALPDRLAVIVAAAQADDLLREILSARLLLPARKPDPLFDGPTAAFSTLSARTEAAYRLGVLTPSDSERLNALRRIRNKSAHRVDDIRFSDPSVRRDFDALVKEADVGSPESPERQRRLQFEAAVGLLVHRLTAYSKLCARIDPVAISVPFRSVEVDKNGIVVAIAYDSPESRSRYGAMPLS